MRLLLAWFAMALFAIGLVGCGGGDNSPPQIAPIPNQPGSVGVELPIALRASDPDGDRITFSVKPDNKDINSRSQLLSGGGGTAIWKWVPNGSDVGPHTIVFSASDGKDSSSRSVIVEIKSAAGSAGTPVFRKPLGTGTTLDLSKNDCLDVPIVIDDADSPSVIIDQEAPLIEGAELNQTSGTEATWHWCPSDTQKQGGELFSLVMSAYDQDNPKVIKEYLIVLQKQLKPDCPGPAPVINHVPSDESTTLDLTIMADVSDDKGLKYPPQLYYSDFDPGLNPDLGELTQVTMTQIGGDLLNGTWFGDIPNPVAEQPVGSSASIYYLIVANDNDDEAGDCDHVTYAPDSGVFSMKVTNSGGSGGLPVCKPCTSDVQCGYEADNCIWIGSVSFCGQACQSDYDCPSTHECSTSALMSLSGALAKQCVPTSGSCTQTTALCQDDSYEENDVLSDVKTAPALDPGTYTLKSCPGAVFDDEDWYPIEIATESNVTGSINGGTSSNLDLFLTDSTGKILVSSAKSGSQESVTSCLAPGRYYFHVYAWSKAENSYTLSWSTTGSCSTSTCTDDTSEPDDSASSARSTGTLPYKSAAQKICANDDDWFKVPMFQGETIHATLKFTQTKSTEDLDLYLYDSTSKQLTPCTEADPFSCDPANGQSSNSNENLNYSITTSGTYYVVVHGWKGSQNGYDICIDYTSSSKTTNGCPALP